MNIAFRHARACFASALVAGAAIAAYASPASALHIGVVVAQATASPSPGANATARPGGVTLPAPPTSAPRTGGGAQPTPYPQATLGPLTNASPLPYPVYGSPVPGVDKGTPAPNVSPSITLQQSILIAFAKAPALQSARADIAVQQAEVRLQRAGLLPSLSGSAALSRSHNQGGATITDPTTGITTGGGSNSTNASFSAELRQLIFDGGKVAAGIAAATSNETGAVDTYKRQLQTTAFNVASAYYTYLAAERTTQVDLELVREDTVQEDLVRAQVRAGTAARADIATAQLPTEQARVAAVRAQGTELQAEAAFANAMGLDANTYVQPVDDSPIYTNAPVSSLTVPSYALAIKRAIALRPDYDAAVKNVDAAGYNVRSASLGLFPTLSGTASAADQSTDARAGTFRNSNQLGLSLSIPIYDQGVTSANTAAAKAQLDIANAALQTTALGVQLSVKQALTGLISARAALDQTQQEYATAVSNVQATQAQYKAGVTTLPLLLNAQVQLTQALTDQVNAVYALRQAEQTYLYAVGANYDATTGAVQNISRVMTSGTEVRAKARR